MTRSYIILLPMTRKRADVSVLPLLNGAFGIFLFPHFHYRRRRVQGMFMNMMGGRMWYPFPKTDKKEKGRKRLRRHVRVMICNM
ncbi:hypothetical protein BDV33DRAFT_173151 [Aspergillus novoparasiticus]|uniref:Uncharacterized protein n=1 Tax=Aspergillus novoparasiticus TaxID=986946 RepID=A0A5N6EQ67_9EURO|nr:hypothetical protein BDV33DRAFT_173151 [Aspergillus novoparasiticus]